MPNNPKAGSPAPIGHYTPAVRHGDLVFFSGQTPLDPVTGELVDGGIEVQTKRVLANLEDLLKKEGLTWQHVLKAGVFITDMANFGVMNQVYSATLGDAKPARTTVAVYQLPRGALVEIDLVAAVKR